MVTVRFFGNVSAAVNIEIWQIILNQRILNQKIKVNAVSTQKTVRKN